MGTAKEKQRRFKSILAFEATTYRHNPEFHKQQVAVLKLVVQQLPDLKIRK